LRNSRLSWHSHLPLAARNRARHVRQSLNGLTTWDGCEGSGLVFGATTRLLIIVAETASGRTLCAGHAVRYRCVVSNACGSTTSDPASLAICHADFNCDGFVTGEDYDEYVAAFEAGDELADFDADGFVTGDDFDAFVAAFESGC